MSAAPSLTKSKPNMSPSTQSAVSGILAQSTNASTMPTRPLASTQPQLGKGRIVSAKMTFEILDHEIDDEQHRHDQKAAIG